MNKFALLIVFLTLVITQTSIAANENFGNISTYNIRSDKKVGAGLVVGGSNGLIGAVIELNLEDRNSAYAQFGVGSDFNTLGIGWKGILDYGYLSAYVKAGYSRWYNSTGITDHSKSSILNQVLSQEQKESTLLATNFATTGIGVQYIQTEGDFAGLSYFMELELVLNLKSFKYAPTGSIGTSFYF